MERWVVVAGKSGGHILPGLTIAKAHHEKGGCVAWIGENRPLDKSLVNSEAWLNERTYLKLTTIYSRKLWKYPLYLYEFICAFYRSYTLLRRLRIDRVISMGGFISVPVCLAARFLGIPYVLYELNAEVGKAVRYLASGAAEVRCCFSTVAQQQVAQQHGVVVPYPLRSLPGINLSKNEARALLGLDAHRITICVVGGSQGSSGLSDLFMRWLQTLSAEQLSRLQCIHQTGTGNEKSVRAFYRNAHIFAHVFAYSDELITCFKAADFLVTRAGAGILHEMKACNIPGLIIPLEVTSTVHQVANAEAFVRESPALWRMARQSDEAAIFNILHQCVKIDCDGTSTSIR